MTGACVYRAFNADDELLYVGITASPAGRFSQHNSVTDWWPEVAVLRIEHFDSREEAMIAENNAINTESPRHNVRGVSRPLNADALRRRVAERREQEAERERRAATTWRPGLEIRCSNCGVHPRELPKGSLLSEVDCPECGCQTLARTNVDEPEKAVA